jgi:hypothetical protein
MAADRQARALLRATAPFAMVSLKPACRWPYIRNPAVTPGASAIGQAAGGCPLSDPHLVEQRPIRWG